MRKNLQSMYTEMYTEDSEIEEVIVEEKVDRFALNDYTKIVYEGKSGHGDEKAVKKLLKQAVNQGLVTYKDTNSGWMVKSLKGKSMETIHRGEKALHYLRRFLNKIS